MLALHCAAERKAISQKELSRLIGQTLKVPGWVAEALVTQRATYQLTDFYTGSQGITPLSPVLSWAQAADRLAFVYFEKGKYDVYTLSNPRSLKRQPYERQTPDSSGLLASTTPPPAVRTATAW